jgi:hypothetical protein
MKIMAYKTSHRLQMVHKDEVGNLIPIKEKSFVDEVEAYIEDNDDISWVISEGLFEWGESDRSFQKKDKNMKELSLSFPNIIFVLDYEPIDDCKIGEYREYWFNGKVQREYAEITIGALDFTKLKDECED